MERSKPRFNVTDVFAVFIAALLILSALSYLLPAIGGKNEEKIRFVVQLSGISSEFSDNISVGDVLYVSEGKSALGTVTAVDYERHNLVGCDKDGKQVLTPSDELINLYITVETSAALTGGKYSVNGNDILIGEKITVTVPALHYPGELISVEKA